MLPRTLRLTRQGFASAKNLRRATSTHFSISYQKGVLDGGSAVIVSKKTIKSSVGRHTFKRRARAILAPHSSPNTTLIVYARAGVESLPFPKMKNELLELIRSILG